MSNLCLHCGSRQAPREQIADAPTPTRTKTWVPIPHHRLLDLVESIVPVIHPSTRPTSIVPVPVGPVSWHILVPQDHRDTNRDYN